MNANIVTSKLAVVIPALFALSCAPSIPALIRERRYVEATCVSIEQQPDGSELRALDERIDRDTNLHVHMVAVSPEQLRAAAPTVSEEVLRRTVVVRMTTTRNLAWATAPSVETEIVDSGRAITVPITFEALMRHTGERLSFEAVTGEAKSIIGRIIGGVAGNMIDSFFGGSGRSGSAAGGRRGPLTQQELRAEYERCAPNAIALAVAVREPTPPCPAGTECTLDPIIRIPGDRCAPGQNPCVRWMILSRPANEATSNLAVWFRIAMPDTTFCRTPRPVRVRTLRVPLAPGPTIEARIASMFGAGLRPVASIPGVVER
jgi:hypothetical protein